LRESPIPPICAAGVGRTALSPTRSGPEGSSRNEFKRRVVSGSHLFHLPFALSLSKGFLVSVGK